MIEWQETLGEKRFGLRQTTPFPVAVPDDPNAMAEIVRLCAETGYRVLPMGSGSSFPDNFSLKSDRTFAIAASRLRGTGRTESGYAYCGAGAPIDVILGDAAETERKTAGGLLCGKSNAHSRRAALELWQRIRRIDVISSRGELMSFSGPASPAFHLNLSGSILIESRGKLGIVIGVEFDAARFPLVLDTRTLCSSAGSRIEPVISRGPAVRTLDSVSLFDW
ncbi:MAG: FAD-binding oxidoreductase [Calditrichaeota bacterium]|nr:FAD-binding oxidoreductase [Calditrichota bacterium]MCB9366368.1 FAD-binding oxidoreductase [Calditrichota bacterium]MCB9392002.1 FAD-binding oxidoreductase [Calditrichota bacterium]